MTAENVRADRRIPCPACGAAKGHACLGQLPNVSCFGRRLQRLLTLGPLPSERPS